MSYSKIKDYYQLPPYDKRDCVPDRCNEPKKGKCELQLGDEDYVILKADDIETINASMEHRDQEKAVDCIIFKEDYNLDMRKIILIVELKAKKNFDLEEVIEKFENSGKELKKIFQKFKINWKEHQINFVLLSKHEKKPRFSKKKIKKNKKGEKNNYFNFDGKKKIIITKKCDILIKEVWY